MTDLETGHTPSAETELDGVAAALSENAYFQGLQSIRADDEILRVAGSVIMDQAMDSMNIARPRPHIGIRGFIRRLIKG